MSKAIVLLSGGQDSTTALFWAKKNFDEVQAVSIDYGQRHRNELAAAVEIGRLAGVSEHHSFDLRSLGEFGDNALVNPGLALLGAHGLADKEAPAGLPTSFVPGRNLLFLSIAASIAAREKARDVVTGVCQTDFSGYPDCRREFVDALERAVTLAMPSSLGPIRILTPLMWLTKAETVRLARRLDPSCWAALSRSITCYEGMRPGCGRCPACELRVRGFAEAGELDPSIAA